MVYRRIYFRNEEELIKVRMFIRKMRLEEDARRVGVALNAIGGHDIGFEKHNNASAEQEEPLPYSCKKMIGMGYDQDIVLRAYEVYKDMINNAGEGVVVETSLEDVIKDMLNA